MFLRTKLPLLALHSRMTTRSSETAHRNTFPLEDSRQEKVWHLGQGKVLGQGTTIDSQYLASSAVTASGWRGAVRDREETVTSWGRGRAVMGQVTAMAVVRG